MTLLIILGDKRYDAQWQNTLAQQAVANSQWQKEYDLAVKKAYADIAKTTATIADCVAATGLLNVTGSQKRKSSIAVAKQPALVSIPLSCRVARTRKCVMSGLPM